MPSMYIRWFIFSYDLESLYPAVHFLSIWLSGIIAIMNNNGDNASPWNIPPWIFDSAKLFPPAVNSIFQVCMVSSVKFMTSFDILYIRRQLLSSFVGPYRMPLCCQSRSEKDFSIPSCSRWGCAEQCRAVFLCLWILCGILSVHQVAIRGFFESNKSLPLFMPLSFSTS